MVILKIPLPSGISFLYCRYVTIVAKIKYGLLPAAAALFEK